MVKLGSGLLTNSQGNVDLRQIRTLADQVNALHQANRDVVLVSSGAVSAGMTALGCAERPRERAALQACASIGQPMLMKSYNQAFGKLGIRTAQILMTYWDMDSRRIYANARSTFEHLLALKTCVPIVNENDALSFEELEMLNRFGDNDRLSAHVSLLVEADLLVILSSIEGLYEKPDGSGKMLRHVRQIDETIRSYAGNTPSQRSVGGMISKLDTAQMMLEARIPMILANGRRPNVLTDIAAGKQVGTLFSRHQTLRSGRA